MTEDTFPPPDEEELEAANALRQALDGRPGGSRVPEEALQTAAFLRHAGDGGRLSSERRAKLRAELLASLPAAPARAPRKSWRSWFGIGITLFGTAGAALVVGVLGVREWSTLDRASEARSRAMETLATADEVASGEAAAIEATADEATADEATADEAQVAAAAPAEPQAVATDDAPMVGQDALGGIGQGELRPPAARAERRSVARATASNLESARGGSAGPVVAAAPSKRAQSGAFASKAAPADEDGALAESSGSGLGGVESKGGGAVASAPAPAASAPANAVAPAAKPGASNARSEQRRQAQRSQLLAKLGNTAVQSAYLDSERARSASELEQARQRLSALSSAGLGGTSTAAEAEQLRPDVYCRLAELSLRLGQARAALDWTRQGLALGNEPSPFLACLYQQQGDARKAVGDRDGAAQSYMNALQINERLLDESLEGP